jgi:uncharacterized protein with HEPN domain
MQDEVLTYLHDIATAISAIEAFTANRSFAEYERDLMLRSAVERQFGIIGEAMSQLRHRDPDLAARISDHRAIIDFRNVLIHQYQRVRDETVWGVVEDGLPVLRREVEALLAEG